MGKETMEIDKSDIAELHKKIDTIGTNMGDLKVEVAEIRTTLRITPIPVQPCVYLKEHQKRHEENETLWKRPIVSGFIGALFVSLGLFMRPIWEWIKTRL